jgi:hypothetical protein
LHSVRGWSTLFNVYLEQTRVAKTLVLSRTVELRRFPACMTA